MHYDGVIGFILGMISISFIALLIVGIWMGIEINPMNSCIDDEFSKLETSVVTIDPYPIPFVNINSELVDSNGYRYTIYGNTQYYKQFENHNITFGYSCIGGRRIIHGIYMDNDKIFNAYGFDKINKTYVDCEYEAHLRWDVDKTCKEYTCTQYEGGGGCQEYSGGGS